MLKKNQIKQMQIIYWTVFVFLVLGGAISLLLAPKVSQVVSWSASDVEQFKAIIIILAMVGVPGAFYMHKKRIQKIDKEMPFHNKIAHYKMGFTIKMIVIEAFAILSAVGFLVTFQNYFLYLYAMAFVLYLYIMPQSSKIHQEIIIPEFEYEEELEEDDENEEDDNIKFDFNNN